MTEPLKEQIKQIARELGFDVVGIAPAEPGPHLPEYLAWIAAGMHGEQGYLARPDRVSRRRDLHVIMPAVQSLVVVGRHYWPGPPHPAGARPDRGRISCYAQSPDYHHVMLPLLEELLDELRRRAGRPIAGRAYVDTGPLLERDHALVAGLGFLGKNCHLIRPQHGSWLFLGILMLDRPLAPDPPAWMPDCGTCDRCRQACPTAALVQPHVLDSRRCISYLTTALRGPIPRELRPLMGNHIFGCDVCQAACPWNRFARPVGDPPPDPPHLLELLALPPAAFERRFGPTPIGHVGRERFLRGVAVAIGNWGTPEAVPGLAAALSEPAPLLRSHVAWALGRITTERSRSVLDRARRRESDPAVLAEIDLSLQAAP